MQQPQQQYPQTEMTPMQPSQPMMAPVAAMPYSPTVFRRFSARHSVFQFAFLGFCVSTVVFLVGFLSPAWANQVGLWLLCGIGPCFSALGHGQEWKGAVQTLETFCAICFLVSIAIELYQDVFKSPPPPENKLVEVVGIIGGVLGVIGVAMFGILQKTVWYSYNSNTHRYDFQYRIYLGWGFVLAIIGSVLGLLCSFIMFASRHQHATYTNQALARVGIFIAPTPVYTHQPMMMMPPPAAYPVVPVQPQPYPAPAPMQVPQAAPGSPAPSSFVMVQGQMIPVYSEGSVPGQPQPQSAGPEEQHGGKL